MIRWLLFLLALAMAGMAMAQEPQVRPIAREIIPAVRPEARSVERPALAHDARTRPWARAEIGVYSRSVAPGILRQTEVPMGRPRPRGGVDAPIVTAAQRPILRPFLRPDLARGAQTKPLLRAEIGMFAISPHAVPQSMRPNRRPTAIEVAAEQRRVARQRGQICGDVAIQGEAMGRVDGAGACGIEDAVRVRSVAGVTLNPKATMDCRTASALKQWVERGAIPAVGDAGGGVAGLRIVSHYACRNRNNASGGRLSEHAFGRAIDIAGIRLRSGREITVLTDWGSSRDGAKLRQMWRAACGPFGTVLGPESNRFHRDHFHFDTARYRSGSYCR